MLRFKNLSVLKALFFLCIHLLFVLLIGHVLLNWHFIDFHLHLAAACLADDEELLEHLVQDDDPVLEWESHRVLACEQVGSRHC